MAKKARKSEKPARAKPAPKQAPKPVGVAGELQGLEKQAADLALQLGDVRKKIFENESVLRKKLGEKVRLDDQLNSLLRQSFAGEKALLSRIKGISKKKEADLRAQIASLERVTKIFEEKKSKVLIAKKRQSALQKQLGLLEKKAEELGAYA